METGYGRLHADIASTIEIYSVSTLTCYAKLCNLIGKSPFKFQKTTKINAKYAMTRSLCMIQRAHMQQGAFDPAYHTVQCARSAPCAENAAAVTVLLQHVPPPCRVSRVCCVRLILSHPSQWNLPSFAYFIAARLCFFTPDGPQLNRRVWPNFLVSPLPPNETATQQLNFFTSNFRLSSRYF